MDIKSTYMMYKIAHHLTVENGYEAIHINNNLAEIWLEKYEEKTSRVVRISTVGFDWKNHLKKDIAIVFQKTRAMRKLLQGKQIEIHNVYISPFTPIDSWEMLKKPLMVQEKNPIKMKIYYLSGDEIVTEKNRLSENIGAVFPNVETIPEENLEHSIQQLKLELYNKIKEKQKKEEGIFSFGKPIFTYLLIAINAILFLLLEWNGGSENHLTLIEFGAKYNPLIIDGEWWRIVTSMFLHIGLLHFASNMLFLYFFGSLAERIYGSVRFLIIYMLAGVGGGVASFALVTNLSAGASGALYGLFGAFLYFGIFHKRIFFQTIGTNILFLLGINIILGFSMPQLDVTAHFGGLIAGFVASAIVHFPKKKNIMTQVIGIGIYLIVVGWMFLFGVDNNEANATYQLMKIDQLLPDEKYEEVIDSATKGLENPEDVEALLLFQRSYAYIQLNELEKAIEDLEACIKVMEDPKELPQAYFNLSILYIETEDERAKEMLQKAYELNPNDERVIELYESLDKN
ncbi:rhomboid family intramembrane serine protease [Ornithinibacillus halotolerans]|uniref:Rhomboid protease GluP n=1 Tax=Ornithinibacillus halotolerans TaxID=1274357 RepID=A0A916RT45_9BACI|nr:rhomboid family intramembrane serine protease [Ornithinibacillus halotolerans]GGA68401.1 rhomboid protease GluP [Ornithinibacillus halotolerans]